MMRSGAQSVMTSMAVWVYGCMGMGDWLYGCMGMGVWEWVYGSG